MSKLLDAIKIAYVGFAEQYKWNYSVKLSSGTSFSRQAIKVKKSPIYKLEKPKSSKKKIEIGSDPSYGESGMADIDQADCYLQDKLNGVDK